MKARLGRVEDLLFHGGLGGARRSREVLNELLQRVVLARQHQVLGDEPRIGRDLIPRHDVARVDDGGVEAGLQAVSEKDRVEHRPGGLGQAEADVGDAQHGERAGQLLLDQPDAFNRLDS
jgi:hypothetical protein